MENEDQITSTGWMKKLWKLLFLIWKKNGTVLSVEWSKKNLIIFKKLTLLSESFWCLLQTACETLTTSTAPPPPTLSDNFASPFLNFCEMYNMPLLKYNDPDTHRVKFNHDDLRVLDLILLHLLSWFIVLILCLTDLFWSRTWYILHKLHLKYTYYYTTWKGP